MLEHIAVIILGTGFVSASIWFVVKQFNLRANARILASEKTFSEAAKAFRDALIPTKKALNSDIGLTQPYTIIRESFDAHHLAKEAFIEYLKGRNGLNFEKDWQAHNEHYQTAKNRLSAILSSEERQDSTSCEFRNSALACIENLLKYAKSK